MQTVMRLLVPVLLALGLGGCFIAEDELIGDDRAAAPYERITFRADDDTDVNTAVRDGASYFVKGEDTDSWLRFAEIGDNLFIVEDLIVQDGVEIRLYAGLRLDAKAGKAFVYKTMADAEDIRRGLRECDDDTICIDDLEAYADLIRETVAAGAEPDGAFIVTLE